MTHVGFGTLFLGAAIGMKATSQEEVCLLSNVVLFNTMRCSAGVKYISFARHDFSMLITVLPGVKRIAVVTT